MADFADLQSAVVAGAVAGDLAVANIQLYDRIIHVVDLSDSVDLASQFTVTQDGKINNVGGTSTNGHQVYVEWERRYHTREKFSQSGQRTGRWGVDSY